MLTIEEFEQFAEEFPELAECVCLDEVIIEYSETECFDY